MFKSTLMRLLIALCAIIWTPMAAKAQFAGDSFFITPSISIPQGETGTLELAFFSASSIFGAAHVSLEFDTTQLEIVEITQPNSGPTTLVTEWQVNDGRLDVITANGTSTTQPFGTVILAEITVRAIGDVGSNTTVSATQRSAFTAEVGLYPNGNALNASVNIGAPVVPSLSQSGSGPSDPAASVPITAEMLALASQLAPAGGVVDLVVTGPDGQPTTVQVTVAPSAAPVE